MATTKADREERRGAKQAVADARRAAKHAKKLRRSLKGDGRTRFEVVEARAQADLERARSDVDTNPGRAARAARSASARLERASIRATASGAAKRRDLAGSAQDAAGTTDAESRAKAAKKTIKRRRAQAKMANKMATKVALRSLVTSVVTPTDAESRKKDVKFIRRLSKRTAHVGR